MQTFKAQWVIPKATRPTNKYSEYLDLIVKFYKQHINVEDFKKIIDLHNSGFIKVRPLQLFTPKKKAVNYSLAMAKQIKYPTRKAHIQPSTFSISSMKMITKQ